MTNVIDITKTHGMCTARALEQFGFPRVVRKFVTDNIDWLTTKVYFEEVIDVKTLRTAVSSLVKSTPFLRTRHVIDGERDLLIFEEYNPEYNYLAFGTNMMKINVQTNSMILMTSHVVTDLKCCYNIGKELEDIYHGKKIENEVDDMVVFNEFSRLFSNQTDISQKPSTWRFMKVFVDKVEDCFSKEQLLLREMKIKHVEELMFEEICNTSKLFKVPVRGCTTIATIMHTVKYDDSLSDISNMKAIGKIIKDECSLENINPNTYCAKYVYNFIRTDKVFNSVLTHILMTSAELPSFVYSMFGLFVPMKNDTTEYVKIVFQNNVFGSIVITITFR